MPATAMHHKRRGALQDFHHEEHEGLEGEARWRCDVSGDTAGFRATRKGWLAQRRGDAERDNTEVRCHRRRSVAP